MKHIIARHAKIITLLWFITPLLTYGNNLSSFQKNNSLKNNHLIFTRNVGQIKAKNNCLFYTHVANANYFFCEDGIVADFQKRVDDKEENVARVSNPRSCRGLQTRATGIVGHALKLSFVGRIPQSGTEIHGEDEQEYKCNYFIGNVPEKWYTNVPNYSRIVYKDVWEGIDVVYYGSENVARVCNPRTDRGILSRATLKYDIIVHPGANPNQIQFAYEGSDGISINEEGSLVTKTSVGDVIEQTPYVYQIIDGVKKEIPSSFIIHDSVFSIQVGSYDSAYELVIDPLYSTYLGGANSDVGLGLAVDNEGSAYVTGYTNSTNFPVTTGAYDSTFNGSFDVFVTKLSPNGDSLRYSTYIGGISDDEAYGMTVDDSGNTYITGNTNSVNFPTTTNAFQLINKGGYDAFIMHLNSEGDSLIYSSYLGGLSSDFGTAITLDKSSDIYLTGQTSSIDFPTSSSAYQIANKGGDAFVSKFTNGGSRLVYSTFLGGIADDRAFGIAVDRNKNAYVTGQTKSIDFPTVNAYQNISKGGADVFVSKLGALGDLLVYSTYLSGSKDERSDGIAVDTFGNAYVAGYTLSTDFPVTPGAYQTLNNGRNDAFVTELQPQGDKLGYSSYIGGSDDDLGAAISVGKNGNAYITGLTYSTDFPVTTNAFQTTRKSSTDDFLTMIDSSGGALLYNTYIGGSGSEFALGISVDTNENVYTSGYTYSTDFPTTSGAYQTQKNGGSDAYVTKFMLPPAINLSTRDLAFHTLSCSSEQKNVIVTNKGEIDLHLDSCQVIGTNASHFTIISPTTFPVIIKKGQPLDINVRYIPPSYSITDTATLMLYTNDFHQSVRTINLTGLVDSVGITLLEDSINYGLLACDDTPRDSIIEVKNVGESEITITPSLDDSISSSYSVTPVSATLTAGATTSFTIRFHPSGNGNFTGQVRFTGSLCNVVDSVTVSGIKSSDASLMITPTTIDYGRLLCSGNKDTTITITNTGSLQVTLSPAQISGSGFTLLNPTGSVTLNPSQTQKYVIKYNPSQAGTHTGTFKINASPCNLVATVNLKGIKDTSMIIGAPLLLDYGTINCSPASGGSKDSIITIWNVGTDTITLDTMKINNNDGSFRLLSPSGKVVLTPGDSQNYRIRFEPIKEGSFSDFVRVTGTPCLQPSSYQLKGACQHPIGAREKEYHVMTMRLHQNYPNPFSRTTVISYELLPEHQKGLFEVQDMLGRIIHQEPLSSKGTIQFDASLLQNGVYSYTVYDGNHFETKRMVIAK